VEVGNQLQSLAHAAPMDCALMNAIRAVILQFFKLTIFFGVKLGARNELSVKLKMNQRGVY
jgi:hypothetical protein